MGADPLTMLMVASTVVATGAQIKQGNIAKARSKEVAAQRDLETNRQVAQLKRESQERQSRNRAAFAASGGGREGGSALALTAENLRRDADNQLAASITGRSQSRAFLLAGKEQAISAYAGAASSALGGAQSLIGGMKSKATASKSPGSSQYTPYKS